MVPSSPFFWQCKDKTFWFLSTLCVIHGGGTCHRLLSFPVCFLLHSWESSLPWLLVGCSCHASSSAGLFSHPPPPFSLSLLRASPPSLSLALPLFQLAVLIVSGLLYIVTDYSIFRAFMALLYDQFDFWKAMSVTARASFTCVLTCFVLLLTCANPVGCF